MQAITVSFDERRNKIEVAGPRWRRSFSIIAQCYQGAYLAAVVEANRLARGLPVVVTAPQPTVFGPSTSATA